MAPQIIPPRSGVRTWLVRTIALVRQGVRQPVRHELRPRVGQQLGPVLGQHEPRGDGRVRSPLVRREVGRPVRPEPAQRVSGEREGAAEQLAQVRRAGLGVAAEQLDRRVEVVADRSRAAVGPHCLEGGGEDHRSEGEDHGGQQPAAGGRLVQDERADQHPDADAQLAQGGDRGQGAAGLGEQDQAVGHQ